jgi:hypothetical protein
MSTDPGVISNQVLDEIGHPTDRRIGDLEDGSAESKVLLRHYGPALRQISRAAHWNCLRHRATMKLLQDSTGNTTNQQQSEGVPITVGRGTIGMRPWTYEYAWPTDCVKARFVPMSLRFTGTGVPPGNIALPSNPLMSGLNQGPYHWQRPARFVVSNDDVPNLQGAITDWSQLPDTATTLGQGLTSQTVILTNQPCAELVYTRLITYPDQWDPLFRQAFVAYLGSQVVMALTPDRKLGVSIREEQIKVCKQCLDFARISDGDEGWFSVDHVPDWLRTRNSGPFGSRWSAGGGDEMGVLNYGYDSIAFSDGSAY